MRHFIVADQIVSPYTRHSTLGWPSGLEGPQERRDYYATRLKMSLPVNYRVARLPGGVRLAVAFVELDRGLLLLSAPSIHSAYWAAKCLESFFVLYAGHVPDTDRPQMKLTEVKKIPRPEWTAETLMNQIVSETPVGQLVVSSILSGRVIPHYEMESLRGWFDSLSRHANVAKALAHLGYSRRLFNGYMTGSYYHFHYSRDRRERNRHDVLRLYLENREVYELAFVAAFKRLESFLGTGQIKANQIDSLLRGLGDARIQPTTKYLRRHEVFTRQGGRRLKKNPTFAELIKHFLDIRNAVAAHSNPNPPARFCIAEDSIIEVQLFLSELCTTILGLPEPQPLTRRAYLKSLVGARVKIVNVYQPVRPRKRPNKAMGLTS